MFPPAVKSKLNECEPPSPIVTPEFETMCLAASKVKVLDIALAAVVAKFEVNVISPLPELEPPDP